MSLWSSLTRESQLCTEQNQWNPICSLRSSREDLEYSCTSCRIFEEDEKDPMAAGIQALRQCGGPSDGRLRCDFRKEKKRESDLVAVDSMVQAKVSSTLCISKGHASLRSRTFDFFAA